MDKGRPVSRKGGWIWWLALLIALALLAWLLARLLAPATAPVVATAPPAEPIAPASPAPATPKPAATAPAAPEPAAPAGDPLVVEGVDIGAAVSGALQSVTRAFAGITDPASARAALPRLTEARDTLAGLEATVTALPEAGRSALTHMIAAAMPGILTGAERLKADGPVNAVTGPVIGDILARLTAFAA